MLWSSYILYMRMRLRSVRWSRSTSLNKTTVIDVTMQALSLRLCVDVYSRFAFRRIQILSKPLSLSGANAVIARICTLSCRISLALCINEFPVQIISDRGESSSTTRIG